MRFAERPKGWTQHHDVVTGVVTPTQGAFDDLAALLSVAIAEVQWEHIT
jgi:hypothetical protein